MNRAAGALLACALAGCAPTPPPADSAALVEPAGVTMGTWRKVDAATGRLIDLASLAELAAQFPDSGAVQVRYFNALLRAGDASNAYALLDRISARGYRFSAEGERQINAFFAANGYDKALALTQRPGDAREASALIATVPADIHIVESVLRERASGRLYVTSVASRGLFREDGKGGWERVELGPVGSIAGMVQARDGAIWVASGSYDQTPDPASAFRGFVGLDPASGVIWRMPAPPDATLSDIALGADGALYASDPLTGAIYRGRAGEGSVAVLVPAGTFRSGQGLAASPDGDFLYVSDYGYGLALVDLRSGRVDRVPAPNSLFIDGTDGLFLHEGELVAVQNGTRPPRIVAHRLSPDGRSITSSRLLEAAHPGWTEPGTGTIVGAELLYVATGQWDRFGDAGAPIEGKPPLPAELRMVPLAEKPAPPPKKRR